MLVLILWLVLWIQMQISRAGVSFLGGCTPYPCD